MLGSVCVRASKSLANQGILMSMSTIRKKLTLELIHSHSCNVLLNLDDKLSLESIFLEGKEKKVSDYRVQIYMYMYVAVH